MGCSSGSLLSVFIFISLVQFFDSRPFYVSGDDGLIQRTCRSTKYYDLCVESLKSDPASPSADTKGLAMILVGVGAANATATSSYLSSMLLSASNDTSIMKKVLKDCANRYTYSSDALQASRQALVMEAYDYAYMHVIAAADYPNVCYNTFKKCPSLAYPPELGPRADGLKRLCNVVLGIIDLLDW